MKTIFAFAFISLMSLSASAYKDGSYPCKHKNPKLPDNMYRIQTLNIGGVPVPYVEASLYFFSKSGDENSPIVESNLKGLAIISSSKPDEERLEVAALSLSFKGDVFMSCRL